MPKRSTVADAKVLLQELGYLTDVKYSTTEDIQITYGKVLNGEVVEAASVFDAQFARVDFFRDILGYPVYGPDKARSLVNVFMAEPAIGENNIIYKSPMMEIREWSVIEDTSATYPIIPVAQAWAEIQNGNGVISSVIPRNESILTPYVRSKVEDVFITKVYLAYYDAPDPQDYMQPIYVFEGKYNVDGKAGGSIVMYFPAIAGQYVGETQE